MTKISTELEQRLYHELNRAAWWLENLAERIGDAQLVDSCPNGWGGRGTLDETPCYRVDIGAGVDSLMPCDQARRI